MLKRKLLALLRRVAPRFPSVSAIARRQITANVIETEIKKLDDSYKVLDVGSGINNWKLFFETPRLACYETVELKDDLVPTFCGDFLSLEFPHKYDVVIATELIEHLPDSRLFFCKASEVLNTGGALVISFPFYFKIYGDPSDFFRFTRQGIEELSKDLFYIEVAHAHGGKYQVVWETLIDGKVWYPLRVLNPLIASTRHTESAFPLGYVILLRRI